MSPMKLGPPRVALLVASAAFGMSVAAAQTAPPPAPPNFANPPYKNLKVFPQAITRDQLIANMKLFSQSLGVRCTFCHVGEEGKPLSTFDFASDAKAKKQRARVMLLMAHRINSEDFDGQMKVTCFTCHRGSTKPLTAPPPGANFVPPPPGAPPLPPPKPPERGA
ncbi:MAG TPA: c-type cytochrome [Sphingomicrobium sp.]|nr:c-type cytochrome [Sphingomicrobium sp.]